MIRLALSELRRYRLPMQRIALVFLVLLPSLYGGLYLWSNWDPYGHLGDIKVAVVNEDRPVTVEGQDKPVAAGDQVVDELKADPIVDWTTTDAEDAAAGLSDGTYLMTITIPPTSPPNWPRSAPATRRPRSWCCTRTARTASSSGWPPAGCRSSCRSGSTPPPPPPTSPWSSSNWANCAPG